MKTIVLCSSASFYKHLNEIADELGKMGYKAVVPLNARRMRLSGNYDTKIYKTWYENPDDFSRKARLIREHFRKITYGDIILVINDEKNGIAGYIGANALMEMGLAFHLHKPIYVLNDVDKKLPFYEEVYGMGSVILHGDLGKIGSYKKIN